MRADDRSDEERVEFHRPTVGEVVAMLVYLMVLATFIIGAVLTLGQAGR